MSVKVERKGRNKGKIERRIEEKSIGRPLYPWKVANVIVATAQKEDIMANKMKMDEMTIVFFEIYKEECENRQRKQEEKRESSEMALLGTDDSLWFWNDIANFYIRVLEIDSHGEKCFSRFGRNDFARTNGTKELTVYFRCMRNLHLLLTCSKSSLCCHFFFVEKRKERRTDVEYCWIYLDC